MFKSKRILSEIDDYEKNRELINKVDGIYLKFNEQDLTNVKVLIIGKNGSYDNMPLFFSVNYTKTYPMEPMEFKFITACSTFVRDSGYTRFNPNLYTPKGNGKVCLSLLGTWNGPGWVPTLTLVKICLSIQGEVMTENALNREPPYNYDKILLNEYDELIRHQLIFAAYLGQVKNTIPGFEDFQEIIEANFVHNFDKIIKEVDENIIKMKDKDIFYSKSYGITVEQNYVKIKNDLIEQYNKLKHINFDNILNKYIINYTHKTIEEEISKTNEEGSSKTIEESSKINEEGISKTIEEESSKTIEEETSKTIEEETSTKGLRKSPIEPAKNYNLGYMKTVDNITWMVKERKNNVKYWSKII